MPSAMEARRLLSLATLALSGAAVLLLGPTPSLAQAPIVIYGDELSPDFTDQTFNCPL